MRFLDTLSLHMCTNGMTSFQRMLHMAHGKGSQRQEIEERRLQKQKLGISAVRLTLSSMASISPESSLSKRLKTSRISATFSGGRSS